MTSAAPAATPSNRAVPATAPGWLTKVRPATAGRVLVLTAIASAAADPVVDPDSFWHLATGKLILKTREIPKSDPFSWTAPGRKWVAHEWLTEILFGLLHAIGRWPALVAYAVVTITISWAIVARTCRRLGASGGWTNAVTLLAALSCLHTWGARPQMLSLLFGAIYADLFVRAWQGRPKLLWWCVPIMLIWCNAHGGYMFGIASLLLFVCGLVAERVVARVVPTIRSGAAAVPSELLRHSTLALVATIAISLVNPNGIDGFLYPFSYLGDNASTRYIEEWFSPTFARLQWWPFFALLVVGAVAAWKMRRSMPIYAVVGMAIYGALGIQSVRNITQFSFFAAPFLALALTSASIAVRARNSADSRSPVSSGAVSAVLPMAALISAVGIGVLGLVNLAPQATATAQANEFPAAAARFLQANPTVNLYNQYDWGGYLLWSLKQPVGIDGRPDMYGDTFVDRYVATWNAQAGWEDDIDRADVRSVLGRPDAPLVTKLRARTTSWRVAYEDRQAVLLVKLS